MKGIVAAFFVLAAAYLTDQYFAHGKYSDGVLRMIGQMRHSMGI